MLNIVSVMTLALFNLGSFVQGSVNDGVGTTGFRQQTELSLLSPVVDLDLDGSQRSIPIDLKPSVGRGAADNSRRATMIIESLSGSVHLIATEVID